MIMDYEKAYKEALERAKEMYVLPDDRAAMEYIFPELKESEDERIRKEIIQYLQRTNAGYCNSDYNYKAWISWLERQGEQKEINLVEILKYYPRETKLYSPLYGKLWLAEVDEEHEIITCYKHQLDEGCVRAILEQEDTVSFYSNGTTGLPDFSVSKDCMLFLYDIEKQGEQKLTDKVEPKFKVGDWLCENELNNYARFRQILEIVNVQGKERYRISRDLHNDKDVVECRFIENNWHLFNIQDAKDGDVLYFSDDTIVIFKDLYNSTTFHSYCHIEDGVFDISKEEMPDWWNGAGFKPATKEQRDLFFANMEEAGYEWDAEKKELKKISQRMISAEAKEALYDKPIEWSEEDEKTLNRIRTIVRNDNSSRVEDILWLKSLKDKVHPQSKQEWSEEDEKNLNQLHKLIVKKAYEEYEIDTEDETLWGKHAILDNWLKSLKERIER